MDVFVSSIQRPPVYQLGWETPSLSPPPPFPLPHLLLHTYVYTYMSGRNGRVSIARVLNAHDALSAAIARARWGCQCGVSPIMCTIIQCYMARRPPLAAQFHPTAFGRRHSRRLSPCPSWRSCFSSPRRVVDSFASRDLHRVAKGRDKLKVYSSSLRSDSSDFFFRHSCRSKANKFLRGVFYGWSRIRDSVTRDRSRAWKSMKNQVMRSPAIFLFRAVVSKVREFDQSLVHDEPCLSNLPYVSRVHSSDSVGTSRDRWR